MANTTIQTTDLDFDEIKASLKTYFAAQSEFSDYDFEGSGLSNILDVMAYNSHFNALMANFALNESFLSTSQLRSSAISHAQTIGYTVRSRACSTAQVTLSVNLVGASLFPLSVTLPKGTQFSGSVDGLSYTFITNEEYYASDDGSGTYTFETTLTSQSIPIYQGSLKTKTFIVGETDERQLYVIPDDTIDSTTLDVKVYDTYASTQFTSYTPLGAAITVNSNSNHFIINETPNEYYEISFGDGITYGNKPLTGNKISINYISCVGAAANGASLFSPVSQISVNSVNYDLNVTVVSSSADGGTKETLDSIKANAPSSFASQRRLVTAGDYTSSILSNYSSVEDASAWGGEDNDPVNYGAVYVGLKFVDGTSADSKTSIKANIKTELSDQLAILSVDTVFIDPENTYLELSTTFYYNPDISTTSRTSAETSVFNKIQAYVTENLTIFGGAFRRSNLLAEIDDISDAILSTRIGVRIQQRITPATTATTNNRSTEADYTISFPVALAAADDVNYVITSSTFDYDGNTASVKNKLNSNKLQIVSAGGVILVDNVGTYTDTTGTVNLVGFGPGVISGAATEIKISVTPANQSLIKPLRNYIIDIDTQNSYATSVVDRQNTEIFV
jgi:hypothetical protein